MILSVSRRTDIPAYYAEWFMNRVREQYVLVRNPMNYHQVSRIDITPDVIDGIVFWTKNAAPIIKYLDEIGTQYPFYFQYSLNGYGMQIERNLPPLGKKIQTFQELSAKIGRNKVIWRYDPILISEKHTIAWHLATFHDVAKALAKYTNTCIISFVDMYLKIIANMKSVGARDCTEEEIQQLAGGLAKIAAEYGIKLQNCSEAIDLEQYNIEHGCCIDGRLLQEVIGCKLKTEKDPNQRVECGCIASIDIGQYNTCRYGCVYCYANFNQFSVKTFAAQHNVHSPFLVGSEINEADIIKPRKNMKSLKGKKPEAVQPSLERVL